jgi:hypothetical protein
VTVEVVSNKIINLSKHVVTRREEDPGLLHGSASRHERVIESLLGICVADLLLNLQPGEAASGTVNNILGSTCLVGAVRSLGALSEVLGSKLIRLDIHLSVVHHISELGLSLSEVRDSLGNSLEVGVETVDVVLEASLHLLEGSESRLVLTGHLNSREIIFIVVMSRGGGSKRRVQVKGRGARGVLQAIAKALEVILELVHGGRHEVVHLVKILLIEGIVLNKRRGFSLHFGLKLSLEVAHGLTRELKGCGIGEKQDGVRIKQSTDKIVTQRRIRRIA